jgi:hypothetical protein
MSSTQRRIGPIEVRWGSDRYRYSVTGDCFLYEWWSGMDQGSAAYPLSGMSPDLLETVGRSPQTTRTARISLVLIASSVIFFFSDYNKAIPLLAPFLLFLGAWWLVNALRKVVPRKWTEVRKVNGEAGFSFVQPEQRTEEWTEFEQALSLAIREVNGEKT